MNINNYIQNTTINLSKLNASNYNNTLTDYFLCADRNWKIV